MFNQTRAKWKAFMQSKLPANGSTVREVKRLYASLRENMYHFNSIYESCVDYTQKEFTLHGVRMVLMNIDNLVDKLSLTESVMQPLLTMPPPPPDPEDLFLFLRDGVLASNDVHEVFTFEDCNTHMMSGYALLLCDGVDKAIAIGLQGFKFRSIDEPSGEKVLRGSREGFVEALRVNLSMMRRRVKNPALKMEVFTVGMDTKTEIAMVYIKGIAADSIGTEGQHRIKASNLESAMAAGVIQMFFECNQLSVFSSVGSTERPDTLCSKLEEGRVAILVAGTPVALVVPFLFTENFQNIDDYAVGFYYATFTRILKFLAFLITSLIPALYVAVGSFHQALLPTQLLYTLAAAESNTPFTLMIEALLMQVIYEILREAGLRIPKQLGFAITIVGAFIIGEAAVTAGLIGAPMVIIVALTATPSLVVPALYEPAVILRFVFIFLAGMSVFFGISICLAFVILHLCAMKSYEVPYLAPISPFNLVSMRDVILRGPWSLLSRRKLNVQDMPGSDVEKNK